MTAPKMFTSAISMMLFYSIATTMLAYSLPAEDLNYVVSFNFGENNIKTDYTKISGEVEKNISTQKRVGITDIGGLVLYSGNLVLDLFLNFFASIPSMATLLFKILFLIMPIDNQLATQFLLGVYAFVATAWVLSLIFFITQIRTQTAIA